MKTARKLACLAPSLLLAGCCHFSVVPAREVFSEGSEGSQRLILRGELAFCEVSGTPEEIGKGMGSLAREQVKTLLGKWTFLDFFRAIVQTPVASKEQLDETVPEEYRRELAAIANETGVDPGELLRANAVVDACCCTAFAGTGAATGGGPLIAGRNMDFAPASLLGRMTLVQIVRPQGARAFAAVGWPGFSAVSSGMNEDGLCAAILLNKGARPRASGIPLGFLVRRILEKCGTVEEARAYFHANPPASGHFIFLADPRTAAVLSRDTEDRVMEDGLLSCTNGEVDPVARVQTDPRARCANDLLLRSFGSLDLEKSRLILGATYIKEENAQAMVFEPAARVIDVARGTTFAPAARAHWDRVELGAALRGEGDVRVTPCPEVEERWRHFRDFDYEGVLIERKLDAARATQRRPFRGD